MNATATSTTRDLLGLQGMDAGTLRAILGPALEAERDRAALGRPLEEGMVVNLFFEDSTRTRTSFTIAAQALGAHVFQFVDQRSSMSKGETLIDTARTIEAMGVGALVVRHGSAGAVQQLAEHVGVPVINAGDGAHEHPTQGLLDILTLAEAHDRLDGFDLSGLRVAIVGDLLHSRVARSAIAGMTTLGAEVVCVGPEAMCPGGVSALGCDVERDLDAVIGEVDAAMALRVQFERGSALGGAEAAHTARYGLTSERASRMKPGAIVMHPGPMNRGLEIESGVADGPRSVVLRQVALGVPVRMSALAWCLGADSGGR
ncbi:MAG: aspartate carbamoyltransferase catalytic subunit [Phycisphaeraceae bacterium]|nr:aspartate carbamoyltransferase catalytic subunit [Phycisphaeraceae bacterium]MCB9847215.1 aspartate carbamoyltransferase catalytic subunit [Phycisphaeraceae bacterium]